MDTVAGGTRPRQGVLQPLVGPGVQQGCQQHPSSQLRSKLNPPITCQVKLTDKFSEIKHSVKFSKKKYTPKQVMHTPHLHFTTTQFDLTSSLFLERIGRSICCFLAASYYSSSPRLLKQLQLINQIKFSQPTCPCCTLVTHQLASFLRLSNTPGSSSIVLHRSISEPN